MHWTVWKENSCFVGGLLLVSQSAMCTLYVSIKPMEVDGKVVVILAILRSILRCHGSQTSPVKIYLFYWVNTISWLLGQESENALFNIILFYFCFQNIPNHLKSDSQSSNEYYHRHYNNTILQCHTYFIKHSCIKCFFILLWLKASFFRNIAPWSCDLPKEWHWGQ